MSASRSSPTRPTGRRTLSVRVDRLDRLRRLTGRDHVLLAWLAEHYVLSTDQIAQALFPSPRAARLRLAILHTLEAISRFVDVTTGNRQYLHTLGPLGVVVHPTAFNDPNRPDTRPPRSNVERTERIIGSRKLRHLLGTNQLFIDLITHTRTHPTARLARWWSEQHTTAVYARAGIQPDGHGIWTSHGRNVGFFLEHDNGTEPLTTVLRKLSRYQQLATFGPRYPVLLRVPGPRREQHLLDLLAGVPTAMPVATSTHHHHPAGPAWTLTAEPDRRRRLHELPSDHGPDNPATNPHRFSAEPDPHDDQA